MTIPKLTLYIGSTCPYCQRVLDYLKQNPMDITVKDVWSNDTAFEEMKSLTGRTQVPCLRMDNAYMHESLDIIDKLKDIARHS